MKKLRKVIVYIATSADGFIARADGSVEWLDRPRPKGNYGMQGVRGASEQIALQLARSAESATGNRVGSKCRGSPGTGRKSLKDSETMLAFLSGVSGL